jgi:UDP-N-acetylmuramate-alanine ligase
MIAGLAAYDGVRRRFELKGRSGGVAVYDDYAHHPVKVAAQLRAGRPPLEVARFMGHAKVTTTLGVYAHLYSDDHTDAMAALGAMEAGPTHAENVVPLWG